METAWLVRTRDRGVPVSGGRPNDAVVVIVLGWACAPRCVEHVRPAGCDVVCLFDFRGEIADPGLPLADYPRRYLFAWSFGVWVAERIFTGVEWTRAVALCGSPYPVDARRGNDPKRMNVTLRGIHKYGIGEFNRRMYGPKEYARLAPWLPFPDREANECELIGLCEGSLEPYEPSIRWDRAVVGTDDVIFPVENLTAYWGERAEVLPLPHYPFGDSDLIEREINGR